MENNPNPENTEVTSQTPENASAIMDALSDEIDTPLGMPLHREAAEDDIEKPENAATIMETLMERTDTPIGQEFPADEELPVSQEVLPQTEEPDAPAELA